MIEHKILIAGFGGQGVVLLGNLLGEAALLAGKHVTVMVSYGVEMRGGTANSSVIISDNEIASPIIDKATSAIILNQQSLDRFENKLVENGLIVLNTSLVDRLPIRRDINVIEIKATDIANELGNVKVANMVALGAYIKATSILGKEVVLKTIEKLFSKKAQDMVEINKKAFENGYLY